MEPISFILYTDDKNDSKYCSLGYPVDNEILDSKISKSEYHTPIPLLVLNQRVVSVKDVNSDIDKLYTEDDMLNKETIDNCVSDELMDKLLNMVNKNYTEKEIIKEVPKEIKKAQKRSPPTTASDDSNVTMDEVADILILLSRSRAEVSVPNRKTVFDKVIDEFNTSINNRTPISPTETGRVSVDERRKKTWIQSERQIIEKVNNLLATIPQL